MASENDALANYRMYTVSQEFDFASHVWWTEKIMQESLYLLLSFDLCAGREDGNLVLLSSTYFTAVT